MRTNNQWMIGAVIKSVKGYTNWGGCQKGRAIFLHFAGRSIIWWDKNLRGVGGIGLWKLSTVTTAQHEQLQNGLHSPAWWWILSEVDAVIVSFWKLVAAKSSVQGIMCNTRSTTIINMETSCFIRYKIKPQFSFSVKYIPVFSLIVISGCYFIDRIVIVLSEEQGWLQ